jgi:hypothetical protein
VQNDGCFNFLREILNSVEVDRTISNKRCTSPAKQFKMYICQTKKKKSNAGGKINKKKALFWSLSTFTFSQYDYSFLCAVFIVNFICLSGIFFVMGIKDV